MKVLQVHNRYRSALPSGENVVVDSEATALRAAGVEIVQHLRSSDEIADLPLLERAALPLRPFHSPGDVRAVEALLVAERPDVMHLHNPNPLISMSVVGAARRHGVPVVMTVHNHRHTCVKGTFRRDGGPCHDCVGSATLWPAVAHGCYRGSRLQSVPAAGALVAHRQSWAKVDRFIAISAAIRDSLLLAGVSTAKIVVKHNAVPDPGPATPPATATRAEQTFLFVGRLAEEKGVQLLLDAWCAVPDGTLGRLVLVGSGPMADRVGPVAAARDDVRATGRLSADDVGRAVRAATVVLVPSVWDEPFGLVVLEAYAQGRAVMSTGMGGLGDLLAPECSWQVPPDVGSWARALSEVTPEQARVRGGAARARYESSYSPAVMTSELIGIYESVIDQRQRRRDVQVTDA